MAQLAAIPQTGGLGNLAQLLQSLGPLLLGTGQQTQNQTGTTTQGTTSSQGTATNPDILAQIQQLLGQITNTGQQFTRENAIADSTGAINTQILDAIRANMPSVLGGQKAAGLYNDTTSSLLTNDLMARIAGEAQKAQQATIQNYGQLTNQNQQTASNLLGALAQANKTQVSNQNQTQQQGTQQTTQTAPIIPRSATAAGAGALGALSLAKQGKDLFGGVKDLLNIGGSKTPALPAFDFGATTPDISSFFSGGGSDILSGGSDIGGAFDAFGSNFGNFSDFGTSGVSDAASTFGSFAGVEPGLSGVFTDAGSDALNLGTAAGNGFDFFSGLGDIGKNLGDLFGDWGSSISDFFTFADGGIVSKDPRQSLISAFEVNKIDADPRLKRYADGGQVSKKAKGLMEAGNIDLMKRPVVKNPDGSISTVRSMSVNFGKGEVLIPTVAADGSGILNNEDAIQQYIKTGQHLGIFDTPENASAYAEELHNQQADQYVKKYADGGLVEDALTPKNVVRGRAGGKSYTAEATAAKASGGYQNLQRMKALWEQVLPSSAGPSFNAPTVIAGNEDALGGASNAESGSPRGPAVPGMISRFPSNDQIQELLNSFRDQRAQAFEDAQPTELRQVLSKAQNLRSADKLADTVTGATTSGTAGSLAAAQGLEGAASALAGSAISGAGSLGTVDALGSLAGNAFLPTYSAASSAAGTGATGVFGSGGAATSGASAPAGVASLTALPFVLAISGMLGGIFGDDDFDPRLPQQQAQDTYKNLVDRMNTSAQNQGVYREQLYGGAKPGDSLGNSLQEMMEQRFGKAPGGIYTQDQYNQVLNSSTDSNASLVKIAQNFLSNEAQNPNPQTQVPGNFDSDFWKNALSLRKQDAEGITNDPDKKRKRAEIDQQFGQLSDEDLLKMIVSPSQQMFGGPADVGGLSTAQQLANAGIPDRMLGFTEVDPMNPGAPKGGSAGGGFSAAPSASPTILRANGGPIGSGSNDPKGNKDNVPILASEGEYVISKPVVDALGQGFFDMLQQAFNVPSAAR